MACCSDYLKCTKPCVAASILSSVGYSATWLLPTVSMQTAGLAFGGTGLCSCPVTGVDGSCAKHLTVESYTVVLLLTVILIIIIIISFPSPTRSLFHSRLKTFSANPS